MDPLTSSHAGSVDEGPHPDRTGRIPDHDRPWKDVPDHDAGGADHGTFSNDHPGHHEDPGSEEGILPHIDGRHDQRQCPLGKVVGASAEVTVLGNRAAGTKNAFLAPS